MIKCIGWWEGGSESKEKVQAMDRPLQYRIIAMTGLPRPAAERRSPPDLRLRPVERVQRPREFQRVLKSGRCFRDPLLRVHFQANGREFSRLGMVVSRKMGNAVVRNRLKRTFRELFRRSKGRHREPLDVVVVPSHRSGPADASAYASAFERFITFSLHEARPSLRREEGRSHDAAARGSGTRDAGAPGERGSPGPVEVGR